MVESAIKSIERHKTAIRRYSLSRPVSLLLQNSIIRPGQKVFDYGCGHGHDVEILQQQGFEIAGYDPYFRPEVPPHAADVVNLGFVLNVIENPSERADVLQRAFALATKVICVSVMTTLQQGYEGESYADGVVSKRKTFQKFYTQDEIKSYLETILERPATPIEPGIFVIFREEANRLEFLETRLSRRRVTLLIQGLERPSSLPRPASAPRLSVVERIKAHEQLPDLLTFISNHGRMPIIGESAAFDALTSDLGHGTRIEQAIVSLLDPEALASCIALRKSDLEVMYATRRFDKRGYPKQTDVPLPTLSDIKAFYGSYKAFLECATQLLFSLGSDDAVTKAFSKCKLGKHLPDAVYVHTSMITSLPSQIRVLIGVAESLLGIPPDCNILKLNKVKRKISFMVYEDFDAIAHPALRFTYVVDVPKGEVKFWDFSSRENPPILHRKESFVAPDYPDFDKFRKLTQQEDNAALLSSNSIGTRQNWEALLVSSGYRVAGHRLLKTRKASESAAGTEAASLKGGK